MRIEKLDQLNKPYKIYAQSSRTAATSGAASSSARTTRSSSA